MNKWLKAILEAVIFFGVFILCNYSFNKKINWLVAVVATVIYIGIDIVVGIIKQNK